MKLMHPEGSQEIEVNEAIVDRYVTQGWRPIAADSPRRNASLSDWQEYAKSKGFDDSDLDGMTRDQIRAALA